MEEWNLGPWLPKGRLWRTKERTLVTKGKDLGDKKNDLDDQRKDLNESKAAMPQRVKQKDWAKPNQLPARP